MKIFSPGKRVVSLLFIAIWFPSFPSAFSSVPVAGTPVWVKPITINYNDKFKSGDVSMGYFFMLFDHQFNQVIGEQYEHEIRRIVTDEGVQNGSSLSIDYDPSWQKLVVHTVKIIRGGQVMDRTRETEFKVIAPEKDLPNNIVDGDLNAVALLQDIRRGDIIEFSYSLIGKNPVYGGKFARTLYFESNDPMSKIYARVILPKNEPLYHRNIRMNLEPIVSVKNGTTEYEWLREHPATVNLVDNLPGWYDSFGCVQLSQFANWMELKTWEEKLFSVNEAGLKGVHNLARQLKSNYPQHEDQLIAALRFVQEEVRYTGIETGEYSHRPMQPGRVLDLRYGDCKGKSILLIVLLKELGIEAHPALVNTYYAEKLGDMLPSQDIFNHTIVQAKIAGVTYYFDPTLSYQRGKLGTIYCPPYRKALILNDNTTGLTDIPVTYIGGTHIDELYLVQDTEGLARLVVTTTFSGNDADDFRSQVATSGLSVLEDAYLKYYGNYFPDIEILESLEVTDDSLENKMVSVEKYTIPAPWQEEDNLSKKVSMSFYPHNLKSRIIEVKSLKRHEPLALSGSFNMTHSYRIALWQPWNVKKKSAQVDNKWYSFLFVQDFSGDTIILNYELHGKQEEVSSTELAPYHKDVEKVLDNLGYTIYWTPGVEVASSQLNVSLIVISLLFILLFAVSARKVYKLSLYTGTAMSLQPIGGWLILIAIGLIVTPPRVLYFMISNNLFDQTVWNALMDPGSGMYHSLWPTAIIYELLSNLFMCGMAVFCLVLLYNKRDIFPRVMIVYLASNVLLQLGDYLVTSGIPAVDHNDNESAMEFFRSVIASAIWIPYMLKSTRVKETFVIPYRREALKPQPLAEVQAFLPAAEEPSTASKD